jgi:hypothetical protein
MNAETSPLPCKFAHKLSTSILTKGARLGDKCGTPCGRPLPKVRHAASDRTIVLGKKATSGLIF